MSEAAVQLRDVFCVHRTADGDAAALQGLSLELRPGERLCVLGPSGAGKTTLLRVVAGLQQPSSGSVLVFGRNAGRLPPRERAQLRHRWVGFLEQHAESSLSPDLRVGQNVGLPLALRGISLADRRVRVAELLDAAGLSDRIDSLPRELSGGERQRAALCMALAHRPRLLLADEPTAELDEGSARAVAALIDELAQANHASVIVVSHDPVLAEPAQRLVRIRDGRLTEDSESGERSLVVSGGGWIRLPAELRAQTGIAASACAAAVDDGLLLTPAGPGRSPRPAPPPGLPELSSGPAPWAPMNVELRRVTRGRGRGRSRREVIVHLTLSFEPGLMTAVTGRSGAGKTTLLELLAGLDRPESGELLLDGQSLEGLDREQLAAMRRERIGYLAQEPTPIGYLSALENVALALRLRGQAEMSATKRAVSVLELLGLTDRAHQRVERLSAGETQRVTLARAIACARGLLIVDEPTSRLDEHNAMVAAQLLSHLARDHQTVISATHDPHVISRADRVIELGL